MSEVPTEDLDTTEVETAAGAAPETPAPTDLAAELRTVKAALGEANRKLRQLDESASEGDRLSQAEVTKRLAASRRGVRAMWRLWSRDPRGNRPGVPRDATAAADATEPPTRPETSPCST